MRNGFKLFVSIVVLVLTAIIIFAWPRNEVGQIVEPVAVVAQTNVPPVQTNVPTSSNRVTLEYSAKPVMK